MKKVVFLFVMLLTMVATSYAETKVMTSEVIAVSQGVEQVTETVLSDSAKLTLLKVYEDTKAGIIGLAKALEQPIEHVYGILVKQQIVYSITYLVSDLFLIIITLILIINFSNNLKRTRVKTDDWYRDDLDDHFGLAGMMIISIIMGVVTLVVIACNLTDIVSGFINPEYGAIKDIVNFIK